MTAEPEKRPEVLAELQQGVDEAENGEVVEAFQRKRNHVTEKQIQDWADEAEAGYDVDELRARRRDRHDAEERFVERGEPTDKN